MADKIEMTLDDIASASTSRGSDAQRIEHKNEMEMEEADNAPDASDTTTSENYNKKRKSSSNKASKKKKSNKDEPTIKELNELRETENMFKYNLFRTQTEELLEVMKIKPKYLELVDAWFQQFVDNVSSIKEASKFYINDFLNGLDIKIPFDEISTEKVDVSMKFLSPHSIKIIGSYNTNSMVGPQVTVDIMVEMPEAVMKKSDCENYRYLKKRAIYLAYVVANLREDLYEGISFYGDETQPLLQILPRGKLGSKVMFLVHCGVHFSKGRYKKFLPEKCNIDPEKFWDNLENSGCCRNCSKQFSTPHYNALISHDFTMAKANEITEEKLKSFPNIRDSLILLKIWLRKRQLGQSYRNFNGHVITCYVLYLLQEKKLNTDMSVYQIVRTVWVMLAQNDWTTAGTYESDNERNFSLCQEGDFEHRKKRMINYKKYYECVFLDATGYHNIAAHISEENFKYVQMIANDSLEYLHDADITSINYLFFEKVPLYRAFDMIVCIHDVQDEILDSCASSYALVNYGLDSRSMLEKVVANILKQGLDKRASHLMILPRIMEQWEVTADVEEICLSRISIGINFNRDFCFNAIEIGPDAKSLEGKQFRRFWGNISEQLQLLDGTTREAIVWDQGTLSNNRYLSKKIVSYLVENKMGVDRESYFFCSNETEKFLQLPRTLVNDIETGEEATLKILKTFDELKSHLRNLKDLPLSINGIEGLSPAFRYTAVFPPLGTSVQLNSCLENNASTCAKLKTDFIESVPDSVPPLEVAIQLSSGKWPDDLEALRKMKGAFNLQIAAALRGEFHLKAHATMGYVDVYKNGYFFRLHLALQKEVALLKEVVEDGVKKYVDNEESEQVERKLFHLAKLNSALHGLHCNEDTFGPACRLAKRWLSSQLIDDTHFPELIVELLMASLFIKPFPYKSPTVPQVAFLRFLALCKEFGEIDPIILNFNSEISQEDIVKIQNSITTSRRSWPPLIICTPYDRHSMWTENGPSTLILERVATLANEALRNVEKQLDCDESMSFDAIFKNSFLEYDILIHLKDELNPVIWQAMHFLKHDSVQGFNSYRGNRRQKLPVVDFNPTQWYLKELRKRLRDLALFFHDTYGGSKIAVLLKPEAFEEKKFKETLVPGQKLTTQNTVIRNANAAVEGFCTLGQGLVEKIEIQSTQPFD